MDEQAVRKLIQDELDRKSAIDMMDPESIRCEKCFYFSGDRYPQGGGIVSGECRRHAPSGEKRFTSVSPTDWCGEFLQKEKG